MRKHTRWLPALSLLLLLPACKSLIPLFMLGEHKQKIPAEFDQLKNSRIVVLVWAEPETLFDYPFVRLELASYIGDKLGAEVDGSTLIDPVKVEDRLQQNLDASADPEKIGRDFKADKVVYLELLEMQMRSPETPTLLQGKIRASVAVYDLKADAERARRTELTPVKTEFPDDRPLFNDPTNARTVRQETYNKFAETVARKFYEYEEIL